MRIIISTKQGATYDFANVTDFKEQRTSLGMVHVSFKYVGRVIKVQSSSQFFDIAGYTMVGEETDHDNDAKERFGMTCKNNHVIKPTWLNCPVCGDTSTKGVK